MIYFLIILIAGFLKILFDVSMWLCKEPEKPKEPEPIPLEELPSYKYNRRKQEPDIDISKAFK